MGTPSESISNIMSLDGAKRMALKRIEAFILTFSDPQAFAAAVASSAPAALSQVTEKARIQEAGHLRCRFPFTSFSRVVFLMHLYFNIIMFSISLHNVQKENGVAVKEENAAIDVNAETRF